MSGWLNQSQRICIFGNSEDKNGMLACAATCCSCRFPLWAEFDPNSTLTAVSSFYSLHYLYQSPPVLLSTHYMTELSLYITGQRYGV